MSAGRPHRFQRDGELAGVYYAIVTKNDDADGPGGRVKVRFPWLPPAAGGEKPESYWAQLAVPMIGDGFGTYTLPEIDDQVAVVFLGGDIRFPVVIGGIWSSEDPPPEDNSHEQNDYRLIKSRSGHRLILDDSDALKVAVTDCSNKNRLVVGEFAAASGKSAESPNAVAAYQPGTIGGAKADQGIAIAAMDDGAKLHVWCPQGELRIEGARVEISASDTLDLKASSIEIRGNTTTIASSSTSNYEGRPVKIGS